MQLLEQTNLAEELPDDQLKQIAELVIEEYEEDLESRSEWEDMHAKWMELFYQADISDNPPWEGSSEEGLPILAEAINQFQSRTYKAFFPNRYFVEAIPVGDSNPEARERAERIAAHMNFQLGVLDRTYKPNKNQMFLAVALHGSDFTKTYFSNLKNRTVIERVRATDLIVPYHIGPVRIEELDRKTHRKYQSVNDTIILKERGYFIDQGRPYTEGASDKVQEVIDSETGISDGAYLKPNRKPCLILEQHRLLDLDDDGIQEPYIVWVDVQSRKVLRLQIRYEVDEMGAPIADKEPIEYFTHYQFMPNPNGFYGLGLGHLLGKLNRGVNKITRMFIDAAEMATVGNMTYLLSENLGIPGDEFDLVMGKGIKLPRNVEDVRKGFMKLDFEGPRPELGAMIEQLTVASQRISSSSDILAGQPDKVYQPTALLSMLEQGLQLYSSVQEFIGHSMEDELNKVYRLNAKYMQSEEYYYDGDKQITVTQQDYQDDFRIVPIFDPKYSTRSQKLAKAEASYQFVLQNPLTAQDPQALYLASKAYAEALDMENIDEIIKEPSIPEVARIDDQNLENAYFLMPPDKRPLFDVFPDQDHMGHIQKIDKFIAYLDGASPMDVPNIPGGDPSVSKLLQSMSNEQKQEIIANLLRHRSLHLAFMFGQMNGVMDQNGQQIGQTGAGAMAEPSADQADLGALMQELQSLSGSQNVQ
jgi:chaperonin GroES